MSQRTYDDIVTNMAMIGERPSDQDDEDREEDLPHRWVYATCTHKLGKRHILYSDVYIKTCNGKTYMIGMVNRSEYESIGDDDSVVFGIPMADAQAVLNSPGNAPCLKSESIDRPSLAVLATEIESVSLFLSDFGIESGIMELGSVHQTL